jgi:hypothetical protein
MSLSKDAPGSPRIDLETIRETLAYIRDDVRNARGLEGVASALEEAVREIDAVSAQRQRPSRFPEIFPVRFLPIRT